MSTHSPYLLSDILPTNVFLLDRRTKDKKLSVKRLDVKSSSLGANIYDLMKNNFFMDNTVGEFITKKINKVIMQINEANLKEKELNSIEYFIEQIGEPIIRKGMKKQLAEKKKQLKIFNNTEQILQAITNEQDRKKWRKCLRIWQKKKMIHIKIEKEEIKKIQKRWSKWFFREKQIEEFIEIMDSDDSFRKMIFKNGKEYLLWKNEFIQNREVIKNTSWKRYIIDYFFRNLSKEDEVIRIYKKDIKKTTREYLIRKYENYRKSVAFIDIVKILNVQVCPYCNRNFLESYTIVDEYGKKKRMFKGDIDHYYSKNEIPALALSFYNEKNIDDVENRRYDSTVWQGISDNFKIKIRDVNGENISEHMGNSNLIFRLEKKYNQSKEYAKEIIRKKYIYPETYKDDILKNFGYIFKDESDLLETFYSISNSEEFSKNIPLSKFTKDILKQLGILDETE